MIYDNIVRLAKERDMPLYFVEQKADIGAGCISRFREHDPNIGTLKKIADALGCKLVDLLDENT